LPWFHQCAAGFATSVLFTARGFLIDNLMYLDARLHGRIAGRSPLRRRRHHVRNPRQFTPKISVHACDRKQRFVT